MLYNKHQKWATASSNDCQPMIVIAKRLSCSTVMVFNALKVYRYSGFHTKSYATQSVRKTTTTNDRVS